MKHRKKSNGFTLVEVLVAMTILVASITLALAGYMLLLKKSNNLDTQLELDLDAQSAIERLKIDLRLSSMDEIFGYPANTPPYEAICFPMASIDSNTGMLTRDETTKLIIWDRTVVYHIVPGAPDKLTRTSFDYDTSLSDTERQDILDRIVEDGGTDRLQLDNVETKVIFDNLLNWELLPEGGWFSTYSESAGYSSISLGYALLEGDENVLEFTAKDNGQGFDLGIDQIMANTSLRYHEAELALDHNRVSYSGGDAPVANSQPLYGNKHELFYDAKAEDNTLTLTIPNDVWQLTDFDNLAGSGNMELDQTVINTDYAQDEIFVELEGNEITWSAENQTADFESFDTTSNILIGATVTVLLKGSGVDAGGITTSNGERCKLTFRAAESSSIEISNVSIAESASSNSISWFAGSSRVPVSFTNGPSVTIPRNTTRTSNWIDLPINKDKNYLVQFNIDSASAVHMWGDERAVNTYPATVQLTTNGVDYLYLYVLPALESLYVSYVDQGTYTSDIMDTRIDAPIYDYLSWQTEFNAGKCAFKVRSGDEPDLSDAADFDSISGWTIASSESSRSIAAQTGRYIQFQTILASESTHQTSPKIRKVELDWAGESRMVNMNGRFTTGPTGGDFYLTVNGTKLRSALQVDMEIYKDITIGVNDSTQRISSAIKADITPRNSGL